MPLQQTANDMLPFSRYMSIAAVLCLLLTYALPARCETVTATLPSGVAVNAEYIVASPEKPAIIVLHGFLQTYEFMSTWNIVNGLSSLGYAVLAPNISLGVPDRKQSAQCQAAHTHTFASDLSELDFWADWLQKKGYKSLILIGHSWGSQYLLGYKVSRPKAPVIGLIAISLVRSHESRGVRQQQITLAKSRIKEHASGLQPYKLSFCEDFMATPQSYLSYAEWSDQKVLDTLAQLKHNQTPTYVIIGGQDKRSDSAWLKEVRARATELAVIEGANHFFSDAFEFELNDRLEKILHLIDAKTQ